jgi:hypothetical protein
MDDWPHHWHHDFYSIGDIALHPLKKGVLLKRISLVLIVLIVTVFSVLGVTSYAQQNVTQPKLGTASSFAVLGGSTVTNTGASVLFGNLGVDPGSAITGFPPGIVHGAKHKADAVALQAQKDVKTAYNQAAAAPCNHDMTGVDLGGKSLKSGVYCFSSSAQLTKHLTLKGQGVFIFQVGSKLTTASNALVSLIGGASPCNVFWQIGSSATVGTHTAFVGNILALTDIHAASGATFNGSLYARNGEVTLDDNTINRASCVTPGPRGTPTVTGTKFPGLPNTGSDPTLSTSLIPQKGSFTMSLGLIIALILLIVVLAGIFAYRWRATYATVGSFVAAIAALLLFLMAIGVIHV